MNWQLTAWLVGLPAALYGLHRFALKLEEEGHLYYIHKRPEHGAANALIALQRAVEPQSQHVEQVNHEYHRIEEDEAGGRGKEEPEHA